MDIFGLEPLPLTPHLTTHTGTDRLTRVSIIVENVVKARTGETDYDALQDEER